MATCSLCKSSGLTLRTDIRDLCPSCQKIKNDESTRKFVEMTNRLTVLQNFHAKWSMIPDAQIEVENLKKEAEAELNQRRAMVAQQIVDVKNNADQLVAKANADAKRAMFEAEKLISDADRERRLREDEEKLRIAKEEDRLNRIKHSIDLAVAAAQEQIAELYLNASRDFVDMAKKRSVKSSSSPSSFDRLTPSAFSKISGKSFVAFDFETTGLSPARDQIIEIGAILYVNGKESGRFSTLIKPTVSIPERITKLTGITNSMVSDAPNISNALPDFLSFIGDHPLVAHNASFDIGFLEASMKNLDLYKSVKYADSLEIAKKKFHGLDSYRLGDIACEIDSNTNGLHRALADCRVVCDIVMINPNSVLTINM